MIKVSDYIAKYLKQKYNIKHIFMLSGGGAMHLNDSFGRETSYTCLHNEQALAIAGEGYCRYDQQLAVVNVTTGPGGLNCLNGVFGQWTDSAAVLYISGQVKFETTIHSCPEINLRQLGDQEVDIISVVKPLVKYCKMVENPYEIKAALDKAVFMATNGRKGPVWLDIPMNVQGAVIEENKLFETEIDYPKIKIEPFQKEQLINKLKRSNRPLIIAGHGIRLSEAQSEFEKLQNNLKIPIVTTLNGMDSVTDDNPYFIGRIGTIGQRAGNFALQNADLILCLGTRNNIRQVSYNWENFAKKAFKIVIDIDSAELKKPTIKPDLAIHANLKDVIQELNNSELNIDRKDWLNWCLERRNKYLPNKAKEYAQTSSIINPYFFVITLTELLKENELIVTSNASSLVCTFQAGTIKRGQRVILNSGNASMGYDLPAAIGACIAADKKRTICLTGDGSIMMNIQELQTIKHHNLPIKIFVFNNNGYSSIKQTQGNFFNGHLTACEPDSGVSMPNFANIAKGFGIEALRIDNTQDIGEKITKILETDGPFLCDVIMEPHQIFIPKLSSEKLPDGKMISKPLEDMYPFLDREEFKSNMLY